MPRTIPNAGPLQIAEHFCSLEDPRVVGRSAHPLLTVIVMALVGVICGANGWDDIREIAVDRRDWFARWLVMPNGVPSADLRFAAYSAHSGHGNQLGLRCRVGTQSRRAAERAGGRVRWEDDSWRVEANAAGLDAAPSAPVVQTAEVAACARRRGGRAPGIDAARELLAMVELRGAIVTGDAAHCCAETAQKIVDGGADYVLQVKANRAALYDAVDRFFETARAENGPGLRHARTAEVAHGRGEVREA